MSFSNAKVAKAPKFLYEYPLTQGQAALWFHYNLAPESVAYNLAGAVTVPGDTNLDALQRAFQRLAERHPMLRTLFTSEHGKPLQRVSSSVEIAFRVEDAAQWDTVKFNHRLAEEIYRPFDLELGPTWQVVVFRRPPVSGEDDVEKRPQEYLVLLVLHHILGDLWSIAIIMSEVAALYRQEITGSPARLKPLRSSYADQVNKEVERLAGPRAEASRNYWQASLSGELSPLSLPLDRPRPPVSTGRGADHAFLLDQKLADQLRALAGKYHVPIHTILLSAFQILLHRYSGQNDILVGFPKAGRSPSSARVVGYFVNQMVVRANFSKDLGFIDFLKGTQKSIAEGSKHDWYPFSLLVQHLQPDRDLSRSPLIQAVFSWQQAPRLISSKASGHLVLGQTDQEIELGELTIHSVHLPQRVSPFDLMMLAAEASDGLAVTIEYSTDLFEAATIARMARSYRTLLESVITAPAKPVSELNILPDPDRVKLVDAWSATPASYPSRASLQLLFEEQVERTPKTIAVVDGEEQLTFSQLNRRANRLAHYLQAQGIGLDSLVGVCLEPSVQMVVALLGILKAGGAYLPLDPANPKERLAFMLGDARPTLVLTRQALRSRLPDFSGILFLMDADESRLRTLPKTNPPCATTPDHLAYVIYTSGSTGRPKGVALAHRGVVNLLADFQRRRAIQPGDACSWWTSPGFDVSVYEIFSPLLAGGSLHVIPQNIRLDASRLLDWLSERRIRSAYLPQFFLEDFSSWVKKYPGASSLHRLLVGVEPIPEALLVQIHVNLPSLTIINGYGPTETTICSTLYQVDRSKAHPGNTPIGRPVANTQIYLLDQAFQPVPIGVVGELYIGGVGLARGYLNQAELTRQRFIPSPFLPGERLYRTGDLARFLPDGNLVFMGRSDTQVKIHGVRIELTEIEATLRQHPRVNGSVVLLHEAQFGGKRLVAFITVTQGAPVSIGEIRHYLEERLPLTMLPSDIVVLDAFPLNPSGKVDRKALQIPRNSQPGQRNAGQLPRSEVERTLKSIWQQVLGVEAVAMNDNFFELGGDSIMSLQIAARAAEAGIYLKPRQIFQAPTVAGLAALADRAAPVRKPSQPEEPGGVIPLTPIQHWFFEQNFPDPNHWNQSLMFVAPRPLDPPRLHLAVSALLREHDAFRLRFRNGPSGWQQTCVEAADEVPFEVVDLSGYTEAKQSGEIGRYAAEYQRSLNLSTGPLIRVVYFDLGANCAGRLLIVIHHLATDSLSWRILIEDLERAYRQQEPGQLLQLPVKTATFQAWARNLAGFAQATDLKDEAGYWLRMADSILHSLPGGPLVPDQPVGSLNTEASAGCVSVSLEPDETRALLRELPGAYGTGTDEVLLTALVLALHRWTGGRAFWVDLESHGREDLFDDFDLSRTVGWFTALYPVRLTLPLDAGPGEAIMGIKEQLRLVPRHGLGYGLLRYLYPDPALHERLNALPPAPVSFNYLGQVPRVGVGSLVLDLAQENISQQRSPQAQRAHLIEVNAVILHGALRVDWSYNLNLHTQRMIEQLSHLFVDELRHLIVPCRSLPTVEYTPSDFPDANLSQADLEETLQAWGGPGTLALKRNLEAIYPLSPMQQGMLFHTLYAPESGVYFEQITFTVQGPFDVSAFKKAWQQVIERHPILRTSFLWQGLDRMLQVVHKEVEVPFTRQDWREANPPEQQARFERLLTAERRRGFDLSTPPLLRLEILQTGENTYHFLLNHHHSLLDGWSISLLFKEVFACYEAFTSGQKLILPPVRPYRDYITWLQGQDLALAEAFWRKELRGFVPLAWNSGQSGSAPPSGATQPAELEEHLAVQTTAALQALARRQHLTLSTLLQGAWAILLGRSFKRDEVTFGITVSGRSPELPGSMNMLGTFINTLPLRVRMPRQAQLVEWLQGIQDKALEIRQYDYSPLAQIQTWSRIPRSAHLFDALLVFENYPTQIPVGERVGSLRVGDVRSIEQTTYALTVAITPGRQLKVRILYDPRLFEPATIRRLLDQLDELLERMTANPNQSLSTLYQGTPGEEEGIFNGLYGKNEVVSSQTRLSWLYKHYDEQPSEKEVLAPEGENNLPGNPLEKHLAQKWEKLLKVGRVGVRDNFFQLGGDSLTGAIYIYQLQNDLRETIPLAAIFESPTVFELARYLEQKHPAGVARLLGAPAPVPSVIEETLPPKSLVPIQPRGSKPPLFCIHPAGGIVFPYYALAACLGEQQPLYGIQDPGLYDGQIVPNSIEAMASNYLEAIKKVQPEGPYLLLGWSAGGDVAYEIAQQLSRQGRHVAALIMLDTPAPAKAVASRTYRRDRWLGFVSWIREMLPRLREATAAIKPIIHHIRNGLYLLAESAKRNDAAATGRPGFGDLLGWTVLDSWRAAFLKEAEVANLVSQDASLLLIRMPAVRRILELVREHRRLARRYRAKTYPGRIILFHAVHSGPDKLAMTDPTMGWGKLAENGVEVRTLQANHVALLVKPHVEKLAQELKDCLNRVA